MKRRKFIKFIPLLVFLCLTSYGYTAEIYWVSFTGPPPNDVPHPPGGPKFVMKIDVLGNVLIKPEKIIVNSSQYVSPRNGATALIHGVNETLQMWFPGKRTIGFGVHPIFKAVINKQKLSLVSLHQTRLTTTASGLLNLPLTQRKLNNFVLLEKITNDPEVGLKVVGHDIANSRPNWSLVDCHGGSCSFALSPNGMALLYKESSGRTGMKLLRLDASGIPIGKPEIIVPETLGSLGDVSNVLQGDRRFCVYTGINNGLYLQTIDSKTGKKRGDRKRIGNQASSPIIDPLGRFVIFRPSGGNRNLLKFQALDPLGNASGSAQIIVSDGFGGGLDILKDK